MKRELIIAGAVLIPFAVLVAAGFYFSPTPGVSRPEPEQEQGPRPPGGTGQAAALPGSRSHDAGTSSPPAPQFPPELAAPLRAVLPEVRRCFGDQRLERHHEVTVRFTPTRDGGFEQVSVTEQNPYLAACLEDVFAEVAWHPEGPETYTPASHTFSFDPSPD